MNSQRFIDLALLTITAPRDAALEVMALRLDRDVLWSALGLAAALNAILFSLLQSVIGPNPDLPSFSQSPIAMFLLIAGLLVATVYMLFWIGKLVGGYGQFLDLLRLMVWLQMLRVAVQALTILLFVATPVFSGLFSLVAGVWAFWITGCFVAAGLHLNSPWHGLLVLVLSAIGIAIGVVILGGLIGLSVLGVPANV